MLNTPPEMDAEKPMIRILVAGEVEPELLDCIDWGLEEEGIPASRGCVEEDSAASGLAKRAACESRLHVGIGVNGTAREAVLHHRDMSAEEALMTVQVCQERRDGLICLGKNAARLVKGNPLCFEDDKVLLDSGADSVGEISADSIAQIVSEVVEELFNHINKGRDR